jgi:hypothetical protein
MPIDEKKGLSRSDFGDIVREVRDSQGRFSYGLIGFEEGVCFVRSEEWFKALKDSTVVPGSINVAKDEIMTYELDENRARVLDENGKPKLVKAGRTGWSLTRAVSLQALKNDSTTRIEVGLLAVKEKTAMLMADTNYKRAIQEAEKFMDVSEDLEMKMDQYLEKYKLSS